VQAPRPIEPREAAVKAMLRSRFGPIAVFAASFLVLAALLRAALVVRAGDALDLGALRLPGLFAVGLLYDLVAALWGAVPFAIAAALVPDRIWHTKTLRVLAHVVFILGLLGIGVAAVAEWLFWGEFEARFNFIAVDYLVYTHEVLANVLESYPVGTILAAIAVVVLVIWGTALRPLVDEAFVVSSRPLRRIGAAAALAALAAGSLALQMPQVYANRYAHELSTNGLYDLFAAFHSNELAYEPFYAVLPQAEAFARARQLLTAPGTRFVSDEPDRLARDITAHRAERRLNVVLIVVESLSAKFSAAFGNAEVWTPNLDALARQGILFTRLYATGTRTVRGLEALALSIPPTPGQSIVRRRHNAGIFNLGTVMRAHAYETRFFYGGYGAFDDMSSFFSGNGFEVIDRTDLAPDEAEFANAWGVADEYLFRRVAREASRSYERGKPFFSFVMTTSNHRPFTYPDGRIDVPSGDGRKGAVKYTDWAIGDFLERARIEPWFDDTLFVVVADHCASVAGEVEIPVEDYRIPMVVYAPRQIEPRVVDTLASQIDVAPTLLGLLGFSYRSEFYGDDLLAPQASRGRALLATYERLGVFDGNELVVLSPGRRVDAFRVNEQGRTTPLVGRAAPELRDDAIAYYQTASAVWQRHVWEASHPFATEAR
jgi:phosphoglycerol transferase MdoB-like AlkP superfamily enzyme